MADFVDDFLAGKPEKKQPFRAPAEDIASTTTPLPAEDIGDGGDPIPNERLPDAPLPRAPKSTAADTSFVDDFLKEPPATPALDGAAFSAWRTAQSNLDPAKAASSLDLADTTGLAARWIADNHDGIKAGQDQRQTAAILSVHPGLAEQFSDPVKGSVLKNDIEPASAWEHLVSGRSAMSTLGNLFLPGVGGTLGEILDRVAPNTLRAVEEGADPRYPYYTAKAMLGQATEEDYAWLRAHEATPDDLGATNEFEKAIYGAAGAVPFVAELAAAGAATAAAGIVGVPALIIGGVVAGGLTFAQQVGPMYRRMRLAGVDDSTAFDWSVGAGAAAALINGALAPVAFGIKSLIGKGATEAASDAMIGALTKKGIAWTALKALGGHYATGVGMMTATAAANSAADQMATGGHVDPERLIGDTKEAAINAAEAMGFLAPWGPAADYMRDRGRLARVGEDAARFQHLTDSVNGSKVPDAQIERVLSELKQSGVATAGAADSAQTIYVDKPAFDRLAKANGADARTLAAKVIGDQGSAYDLADKSGMLAVPIEKYAANMVRSGLHESLKADVKFSPDGWTQNEASGHEEEFRAYAAKSAPLAAEAAAIREREMHKALAAGRSLSQAQAHGDMLQAMLLRLANHYKISPEAAYQRFPTADVAGRGSDGEPLASVAAPRPAIGEPASAPTEDFSKTLERQKGKPRPNPYMQITGPDAEPDQTLAPALAADPAKAMKGAGGKYAQSPDEMKQKAEERARSGAYGKDLEGAKALEPTAQARLSLLPPNPGNLNPERLARLRAAHAEGKDIGPIRLYRNVQSGHSVFVDDGQHRIQLARERGEATIPAQMLGENPPDVASATAGHDTTIATPQIANERARYRLREADDLVQSHNPVTFDKNPEYPEGVQERDYFGDKAEQLKVGTGAAAFDPRHVLTDELAPTGGPPIVTEGDKAIVLGGNGRTMMMKRAFEDPAVVEKYREALKAKAAQFGLDPAQIDKMSKPVLVREALGLTRATDAGTLHEAGRRYNDSLTQSLAARTENISEAKALSPEHAAALATETNPQKAIDTLRAAGLITDQNVAEWVRDGALTKEAKAKIGQMLTARVVDTTERFAQTSPAVVAKIEKIAPALARVAGINPAFDETPRVQAGLDLLNEAKRASKTIDQFVGDRQTSLLEKRAPVDPAVLAMAHILEGRGQRDLAAAFEKWAEYAAKDPSQGDMFSRPPTLEGAASRLQQPGRIPAADGKRAEEWRRAQPPDDAPPTAGEAFAFGQKLKSLGFVGLRISQLRRLLSNRPDILSMADDAGIPLGRSDLHVAFAAAGTQDSIPPTETPRWATGWRYGSPPVDALGDPRASFNFRDQRHEPGVSMMHVDGLGNTSDGTYAMFNGNGKPVHVGGFLVDETGSDGEPILVGARDLARFTAPGAPAPTLEGARSILRQPTMDLDGSVQRLQQPEHDPKNLLVQHNLTEENLLHADELGGMPAPSIAVSRVEHPLTGFGEISLLGDSKMVDPERRGGPTFDADIYSTRWPDTRFKIDSKKFEPIRQSMDPSRKITDAYTGDLEGQMRSAGIAGAKTRSTVPAFHHAFLEENGGAPKPPTRSAHLRYDYISDSKAMRDFFAEHPLRYNADHSEADNKAMASAVRDAIRELAEKKGLDPEDEKTISAQFFGEDGGISHIGMMDRLIDDHAKLGTTEVDKYKFNDLLAEKVKEIGEPKFDAWLKEKLAPALGKEMIHKYNERTGNSRLLPYTLNNILAEVTKKIRQGEDFNYGIGTARAGGAKEFSSLGDIKADRNRIIPTEEMNKVKEQLGAEMSALAEQIDRYHPASEGGSLKALATTIGESYKPGHSIAKELKLDGFKNVPKAMVLKIEAFAEKLVNSPTEYFEAKPQRVVGLDEFKAAVIPKTASAEARAVLEKHGLDLHEYDPGQDGDRQRAIQDASAKKNILFQPAFHGTPHDVDKFKMEKIGTGEGAQVYGHGLYFAQNQGIADWYREKLSPAGRVMVKGFSRASFIRGVYGHTEAERAAVQSLPESMLLDGDAAGAIKRVVDSTRNRINAYAKENDELKIKIDAEKKSEIPNELQLSAWRNSILSNTERVDGYHLQLDALDAFKPSDFHVDGNAGRLYEVDVPNSDRLLDHDKPLAEQPQGVKDALKKIGMWPRIEPSDSTGKYEWKVTLGRSHTALFEDRAAAESGLSKMEKSTTGQQAYRAASEDGDNEVTHRPDPELASERLREAGIPGLQYLDSNSRSKGEGDRNFVIWDENEIADLKRLKQQADSGAQERGHLAIIEGPKGKKYEIHLGPGADASTLAHETIHWLVDTLSDAVLKPDAPADLVADHDLLLKWAGYAGGAAERAKGLNIHAEEKIASGWEQYLAEGKAPSEGLRSVFARFGKWMLKIYSGVSGIASNFDQNHGGQIGLSDEVRGVFDRLLATDDEIREEREAASGGNGGGATPPGGTAAAGAGGEPKRKPVPEQSRAWAAKALSSQPLSSISDKLYLAAERTHGRAAIDHAADGNLAESQGADTKRSFAAALHDAAKEILKTADAQLAKVRALGAVDVLTKVAKSAANDAGTEYLDTLQSLLEGAGLRQKPQGDLSGRAGIAELIQRLDFDGRDPAFDADALKSFLAKPKAWNALTPTEAANLAAAALQIRTAAYASDRVMVGTIRAERRATIAQIAQESANRPDKGLEPVTRSAKDGLLDRALRATGLYSADNLKPEEIWKRLGPTALKVWETTIDGRNLAAKMKGEVLRNFLEKFKPLLTDGQFGKALRAPLSDQTLRELNVQNGVMLDGTKMNVETMFMAFLNLGTASSEQRLLGGYKWDKGTLLKAIGREVPKPLLDFGQQILSYSEEKMWPLIKDHAERLNGVAPPKLDKHAIVIRHLDGSATQYDGGYFAAKYNGDASNFARQRATADSVESLDRGARATVAAGFTKARVKNYKDVIDLNWSNYPNHLNSVMHYLAYDEPVRSIGSILRDREFRELATRRIGAPLLAQLDNSIKTIAKGHSSDAAASAGYSSSLISGVLRSRLVSNAMGFSFGMAAQQVPSHTAYAVVAGKISAKNASLALGRALIPENWNAALARSPELQFRGDHYSQLFREALSGHQDIIPGGWKQKVDTAAFAMMDGADRALSHILHDAAFHDALEGRQTIDGTIAGNEAAANEHADRTLRELMPTHNKFEMSAVVRNPGALGALQLFSGLKNVVWNIQSGLIDKAAVENKGSPLVASAGRYGIAAMRIMGSAAVLHLLGRLWAGHGKNDDDGEGLQGWATWAERTAAASLVSLNTPFGGEVAETIADELAHGKTLPEALRKAAADVRLSPSGARLQDTVKQLGVMVDSDKETSERIGAATQVALGNMGGFANQAGKTGGYLRDVVTGDQRPRGIADLMGGIFHGSPGKKNTKNVFTAAQDAVSGE